MESIYNYGNDVISYFFPKGNLDTNQENLAIEKTQDVFDQRIKKIVNKYYNGQEISTLSNVDRHYVLLNFLRKTDILPSNFSVKLNEYGLSLKLKDHDGYSVMQMLENDLRYVNDKLLWKEHCPLDRFEEKRYPIQSKRLTSHINALRDYV